MGISKEQELKAIKLFKLPSSTKLRDTFVCSRTSIPGTLYVFDTHVCFDAPLFRFKDMIPMESIKNAKIPDELFTLSSIEVEVKDGETYRYSTFFSREVALRCISEILMKVQGKAKAVSLKSALSEVASSSGGQFENVRKSLTGVVRKSIQGMSRMSGVGGRPSNVGGRPSNVGGRPSNVGIRPAVKTETSSEMAKIQSTEDVKETTTRRRNYKPLVVMPLIGALALFARQDEVKKREIVKLIKDKKRAAQDTVAGVGKASYGKLRLGAGKVRDGAKEFTKGVANGAKEVKTTSAQQKQSLASTVGGALGGAGGGTV
eukprot:CAMPEP_0198209286 /NCGR_PEP_ID=MMETSP1445-20131203/14822_1 /TAXON_ID=36898 /ORGANISM="Pyramimonas sp., Strain CCMP2087" /LENGTH=316 /DNA_ID=CAMNT_0043883019 /DNA_START=68 /DNA_END=1014 /DNA_ORIENTATION=+